MGFVPPGAECRLCPRLVAFRDQNRKRYADFHNAPVDPFGPERARLLIVGLAPGMRGANRTGRPFTGDAAGELLYPTLLEFGFAAGRYRARRDDSLRLVDCRITNAVRCVPPDNKPTGSEIGTCTRFLDDEIAALADLRVVLVLGRVAHDATLAVLGLRRRDRPFAHGTEHELADGPSVFDSYHCSRYNTNTGRLTPAMFHAVFAAIRTRLGERG